MLPMELLVLILQRREAIHEELEDRFRFCLRHSLFPDRVSINISEQSRPSGRVGKSRKSVFGCLGLRGFGEGLVDVGSVDC